MSHPSWVRGLKHADADSQATHFPVAPLVGAWIETDNTSTEVKPE